jgi:hypothetical protein
MRPRPDALIVALFVAGTVALLVAAVVAWLVYDWPRP